MAERTFIMIKPDHVELADIILAELDALARRVMTVRVESVPLEIVEEHYAVHRGRPFFGYMTASFAEKPVVLAVYEGDDVINTLRAAIGPTDPAKAPPDTIRGKYGRDSLESAIAEGRPCSNVIHRSDSPGEAEREISVWRQYLDTLTQ
jgi:nucleoside-diphosphate kinase